MTARNSHPLNKDLRVNLFYRMNYRIVHALHPRDWNRRHCASSFCRDVGYGAAIWETGIPGILFQLAINSSDDGISKGVLCDSIFPYLGRFRV